MISEPNFWKPPVLISLLEEAGTLPDLAPADGGAGAWDALEAGLDAIDAFDWGLGAFEACDTGLFECLEEIGTWF